jgi:TolB-like protein
VISALRAQELIQQGCVTSGSAPAFDRWIGPHDRSQPSLVVMPFDNLRGAGDEYFVDGIVEEITAALSRVREFFVIARLSAFAYKGCFTDVREVSRELGVDYVVEGAVRRGGDRQRITAQLVDAKTRKQLWSDRYEGTSVDVFEFQDEIAAKVTGALLPAVHTAEIELAKASPRSERLTSA